MTDTAARLADLGIELPDPPRALGAYVPFLVAGDLLYTSGVVPTANGELRCAGVVGADLGVEEAAEGARICALNLLALMRAATGSLDAVVQVLRLDGYVRSAPGFTAQPAVINAASELMVAVLGERGRHTRTAVGAVELPLGAAVEISSVVRIDPALVHRG
ncbi:MAG TPA: RidA family protein [Candidatus Dormibacteraeota bacterium]|jgi:enamine deaminase RidA (YjgF/YER057c/UK114 family)|nr:RidA family protein [Candidatus Dormibacteraeota bacterium]